MSEQQAARAARRRAEIVQLTAAALNALLNNRDEFQNSLHAANAAYGYAAAAQRAIDAREGDGF